MLIRCKQTFGNFTPGDEIEVPDGAAFDHFYFGEIAQPVPQVTAAEPANGESK